MWPRRLIAKDREAFGSEEVKKLRSRGDFEDRLRKRSPTSLTPRQELNKEVWGTETKHRGDRLAGAHGAGFVSILGSKGGEKIESLKNAAGERTYRIAK